MATAQTAEPVRLDFDDYVTFTESHPDGAYELIEGAIYAVPPEGDSHAMTRAAIIELLADALDRDRYAAYTELSFRAPGWADGPRPDHLIARGPFRVGGKITSRPTSREIALVIEIASTSRPKDVRRAALYARLEIPEYWLVDLRAARVSTFAAPRNGAYAVTNVHRQGDTIASSAVEGLSVDTTTLLELAAD